MLLVVKTVKRVCSKLVKLAFQSYSLKKVRIVGNSFSRVPVDSVVCF